mgnify:CR=1 FL=1
MGRQPRPNLLWVDIIQAMISHGDNLGIETHTLKGAWDTNLAVRPERDWEQLKGRSIVNNIEGIDEAR